MGSELEESIAEMVRELKARELKQDELLKLTRELVRECANAIKAIHAREMKIAKAHVAKADELVAKVKAIEKNFEHISSQSLQEYVEIKVLDALVSGGKLPTYKKLEVPFEVYLTGLCDVIGELRREMLEALKEGKKKEAKKFFEQMNDIYESMLPLRFSNSLLPNFRRKQDVARGQVEHARSELLR
ncbi:Translin family protein [Candidatus Burarchaeum australiense]|nr:Translin family protein [Candidatus Burarchaeum australiense]